VIGASLAVLVVALAIFLATPETILPAAVLAVREHSAAVLDQFLETSLAMLALRTLEVVEVVALAAPRRWALKPAVVEALAQLATFSLALRRRPTHTPSAQQAQQAPPALALVALPVVPEALA
jgi:hypothetical protein